MVARILGLLVLILLIGMAAPLAGATWRDKPPGRFQYDTAALVDFTTEGNVQSKCPMTPPKVAVGCTAGGTIYVPNPCRWKDPYAVLLCHEIGHVNGWSGLHEK
jgi:hypothetical protein